MTDLKDQWRPGLPVTRYNFGIPFGGGYWPPLWWRRWGRKAFVLGAIVGWVFYLRAIWEAWHV